MTRVLIVDDSITVRMTIADRLREAGMDVVGQAGDGAEAITLTHRLCPDVILMDVLMPRVDGLAATRQIMMEKPTPIVILSAHSDRQEVFKTYDALALGALEVCAKPMTDSPVGREAWAAILGVVRAATQVTAMRLRPTTKPPEHVCIKTPEASKIDASSRQGRIVAIGASTGGPAAVRTLLRGLPTDFPFPILLAIHCGCDMPVSIGSWLATQCSLNVCDAKDGQVVSNLPGTVIVVPPGRNLTIRQGRTVLSAKDDGYLPTPSIDALFASAAEDVGSTLLGILLTGMGADGAQGLLRIRECGGCTIAQDEASCVVFGMPAAAITLGAAQHVLALEQIPPFLMRLASPIHAAPSLTGALA